MAPKYPSIPEPTLKPESLRDSVLTIKQAFEVLTGQRGNQDYRAVLLPELIASDNADDAAIAANTAAIAANTAAIAARTVAPDTWHSFAYQNGWVDYPAPYSPSGYRRLTDGLVVLRGLVMSGTAAGIAVLPAGWRPGIQLLFAAQTSPNVLCRIDIATTGGISHTGGSNAWISLNGITFLAEL